MCGICVLRRRHACRCRALKLILFLLAASRFPWCHDHGIVSGQYMPACSSFQAAIHGGDVCLLPVLSRLKPHRTACVDYIRQTLHKEKNPQQELKRNSTQTNKKTHKQTNKDNWNALRCPVP